MRRMTRWQPLARIITLENVSDIPTAAEGDEIGLLVKPCRAPKLGWDGTSACAIRTVSERFMMTGDVRAHVDAFEVAFRRSLAARIRRDVDIQNKLLSVLYVNRRQNIRDPGIGNVGLERLAQSQTVLRCDSRVDSAFSNGPSALAARHLPEYDWSHCRRSFDAID